MDKMNYSALDGHLLTRRGPVMDAIGLMTCAINGFYGDVTPETLHTILDTAIEYHEKDYEHIGWDYKDPSWREMAYAAAEEQLMGLLLIWDAEEVGMKYHDDENWAIFRGILGLLEMVQRRKKEDDTEGTGVES